MPSIIVISTALLRQHVFILQHSDLDYLRNHLVINNKNYKIARTMLQSYSFCYLLLNDIIIGLSKSNNQCKKSSSERISPEATL